MIMIKKFVILFLFSFSSAFCFSQNQKLSDNQLKKILTDKNLFGSKLIFNDDNTFVSKFNNYGDGVHIEGNYQIKDGLIVFVNVKDFVNNGKSFSTWYQGEMDFNSSYFYSADRYDYKYNHMGALVNFEEPEKCFFTNNPIPENSIIDIDGIKAYFLSSKIYINENLKMRKENYSKSEVVTITGCSFDVTHDWVKEERKIVFKGMVISPIAKSVEKEMIDGIYAPWYLIRQREYYGPDERDDGVDYFVWIFGGYVTEFTGDKYKENPDVIKKSVESAGLEYIKYENKNCEEK